MRDVPAVGIRRQIAAALLAVKPWRNGAETGGAHPVSASAAPRRQTTRYGWPRVPPAASLSLHAAELVERQGTALVNVARQQPGQSSGQSIVCVILRTHVPADLQRQRRQRSAEPVMVASARSPTSTENASGVENPSRERRAQGTSASIAAESVHLQIRLGMRLGTPGIVCVAVRKKRYCSSKLRESNAPRSERPNES